MSAQADIGEILARLLSAPFPATLEAPAVNCSFDAFEELLAPSTRRLVHVIDIGYHDPQHSRADQIPTESDYRRRFEEAVASAEEHFGTALRPGTDEAPWSRFDPEFFNFDQHDLACWSLGNRLAVVHFGWQFGEDDFEAALSAHIVPDDRRS